jgi:hypothetical protein
MHKPFDIIVLDIETLYENAKPGGIVSGLIIGYRTIYDDVGIGVIVNKLIKEITESEKEYVVIKGNKRINLSLLAKIKRKYVNPK